MSYLVKEDTSHTIGAEFGSKIITIGQQNVKLQIWDVSVSFSSFRLCPIVFNCHEYFFRQLDKNDFVR
jgi:hypothetical protein